MSTPRSAKPQPVANSVLAALPPRTYRDMLSGLEPVALVFGEVLYEPGAPIRDVYFPTNGLVSLLTLVDGRLALEVGLVGREGMVGVALALGIDVSPIRALVHGAGAACALAADDARPGALGPVLSDARVPFAHARRAARRRHRGGLRAAAAQADRLPPRQHHHPRSWRARNGVLRVLRDRQAHARRKTH